MPEAERQVLARSPPVAISGAQEARYRPVPAVALGYDATTDRRKDLTTARKLSGWP